VEWLEVNRSLSDPSGLPLRLWSVVIVLVYGVYTGSANRVAGLTILPEIEVAAKLGQVPIKPDPLKTEKEWFKFWEKLKNYLGRVRGAARLPLNSIVLLSGQL
jgi:hypothetical protein